MDRYEKIRQIPNEYIKDFDENVEYYIEKEFGTFPEFVEKEIKFFDEIVEYIEFINGNLELPEWDRPANDNELNSLLIEPQGYQTLNKCKRKIDFLKGRLASNDNQTKVNDIFILERIEKVELIRAFASSGRLKVSLTQAYKFFEVKDGNVASGELKQRKKEPYALLLNELTTDFNIWKKSDNENIK